MFAEKIITKKSHSLLKAYADSSYIEKQKALVLFWTQIFLIPVICSIIVLNYHREGTGELPWIIIVDILFIVLMLTGIWLLHKGKYRLTVNISLVCITCLTVAGHFLKKDSFMQSGINSFSLLIFAVIIFASVFSTQRIFMSVTIFFTLFLVGLHIFGRNYAHYAIQDTLTGVTINMLLVIAMIFCLSMLNNMIINAALLKTQIELDKNRELSQNLELKVEERTRELKRSIEHIKVLKGLLPICASCKKIRDDNGYWNQIEQYIGEHSEVEFSHSLCPDCALNLYPEIFNEDKQDES